MKYIKPTLFGPSILAAVFLLMVNTTVAHDELGVRPHHIDLPANPTAVMRAFSQGKLGDELGIQNLSALAQTDCTAGFAGGYPCDNIDLMAFMPLASIGQTQSNDEANDIWGWTDPVTGSEYAIIGRVFGTSFIDISDPSSPVFIGELDTHGRFGSIRRDIKVYKDHAFIVSEARRHGMQIFDLTQLRSVTNPPVQFQETAHYSRFGSAHNIVINEDSGFAYGVGTDKCSGGLEMVNIQNPAHPSDAGCYAGDGYTHDAQCVIYIGPDTNYTGKEICFASNEDTLTVVDVSNKAIPVQISRSTYLGSEYTHQGWLTEDQRFFLLDDELDEQRIGHNTITYIWDMSDLSNPVLDAQFTGSTQAIDHNQYIRGNCSFQSNYRAGLRVLSFDPESPGTSLFEVGYFDIYPTDNAAEFNAAWSNYPYFESGTVIISGVEQGLYIVKPNVTVMDACGLGLNNTAPTITLDNPTGGTVLTGSADIEITADDAEDATGTLSVEWQIDGGVWEPTSYSAPSYTAIWDTTTLIDGNHQLTVRATDSGGEFTTDSISVSISNGTTSSTLHVESLAGISNAGKGGKWDVEIVILIGDSAHSLTSGATVNGTWSNGASGAGTCTTDGTGGCTISKNRISRRSSSATFTINSVAHGALTYVAAENHASSITANNPN